MFTFNFCFDNFDMIVPVPNVIPPPVWLLMSVCTPYMTSIYVLKAPIASAPMIRLRSMVVLRYCNRCLSFLQSALAGLVHRNAIVVAMSGCGRLDTNSSRAVMEWKTILLLSSSLSASSLILKRSLFAGVRASVSFPSFLFPQTSVLPLAGILSY